MKIKFPVDNNVTEDIERSSRRDPDQQLQMEFMDAIWELASGKGSVNDVLMQLAEGVYQAVAAERVAIALYFENTQQVKAISLSGQN